jgi:thiamine-phosphate diphosphorylase
MRARRGGLICLVTDRRRLRAASEAEALAGVVEQASAAAAAGVDIFQIRERDLEAGPLIVLVERCVRAAGGSDMNVLVNDRTDVALAAGAHGVHLRGDSYHARQARELLGPQALIGRSVHSAREARGADEGPDFLVFGTVFETQSKPGGHAASGLQDFDAACRAVSLPVLGIGGISPSRAAEIARHGGSGVAGIGLFLPQPGVPLDAHLARTVQMVREAFDSPDSVS